MSDQQPTDSQTSVKKVLPDITNSMKWWLAIFLGFLFLIIALPATYGLTNSIWSGIGLPSFLSPGGVPSTLGVIIHAIVFALVIRLLL